MAVVKQTQTNSLVLIGFILSFFFGVVGSILCYIGLEEIKKTGEQGREMAIAGIVIGIIPMVFMIFFMFIFFIFFVIYLIFILFFCLVLLIGML